MELEVKVEKEGKWWLSEVPYLDIMTQGKTKKEALEMIQDAVLELFFDTFGELLPKDFYVTLTEFRNTLIGLSTNYPSLLFALSLRRQRQKSLSTVRQTAKRLGYRSFRSYAKYESGKHLPSLIQFEKLVQAANPDHRPIILR